MEKSIRAGARQETVSLRHGQGLTTSNNSMNHFSCWDKLKNDTILI
jgi:hypothetical protein